MTGIVYQVQARDDVRLDGWSILVDGILGTGSPLQVTDPRAVALPRQFYRLSAEP